MADDGGVRDWRDGMQRRRARALGDRALIEAMRTHDPWAWGEFVVRFRAPLEGFARRLGIPRPEWDECIMEVLARTGQHLTTPGRRVPDHLYAYLAQALRTEFLERRRAQLRRERRYAAATEYHGVQAVVPELCAESTIRASEGPDREVTVPLSPALAHLVDELGRCLSAEQREMLCWYAERVPHREIGARLGISQAAATKRIERLTHRLHALAAACVHDFPPSERRALERFFRRAEAESMVRAIREDAS